AFRTRRPAHHAARGQANGGPEGLRGQVGDLGRDVTVGGVGQGAASRPDAVRSRRPLQRGVDREVLTVRDVGRDRRVAPEALLHDLDGLLEGVLERRRLLDRLFYFVQDRLAPQCGLAGEVRLPRLLFLTRRRHVHLDFPLPCT